MQGEEEGRFFSFSLFSKIDFFLLTFGPVRPSFSRHAWYHTYREKNALWKGEGLVRLVEMPPNGEIRYACLMAVFMDGSKFHKSRCQSVCPYDWCHVIVMSSSKNRLTTHSQSKQTHDSLHKANRKQGEKLVTTHTYCLAHHD